MRSPSPPPREASGLCPQTPPALRATLPIGQPCSQIEPAPVREGHGHTTFPTLALEESRANGAYARLVRPLLGALLVGLLIPPVAALCCLIAAVQLCAQRRLGRRVLFVQWRAGRSGRPFRILKFRTLERNPAGELVPTSFGGLLRKTHLDELPQLWNVIRGEMSLIGPRPETLEIEAWADAQIAGFTDRLVIRPGITGLAQVVQDSTPQKVDAYREKLRLNEAYLVAMGPLTDIRILALTALRPLRPRIFRPTAAPEPGSEPAPPPGVLKDLLDGSR